MCLFMYYSLRYVTICLFIYCSLGHVTIYLFIYCSLSLVTMCLLAPPAERERSFSNADSSVVVRRRPSSASTFHLKY